MTTCFIMNMAPRSVDNLNSTYLLHDLLMYFSP